MRQPSRLQIVSLLIRRYPRRRPKTFKTVRDLGRIPAGCSYESGEPQVCSFPWLPAALAVFGGHVSSVLAEVDQVPAGIDGARRPGFPGLVDGRVGLGCARVERAAMRVVHVADQQAEPGRPGGSAMLAVMVCDGQSLVVFGRECLIFSKELESFPASCHTRSADTHAPQMLGMEPSRGTMPGSATAVSEFKRGDFDRARELLNILCCAGGQYIVIAEDVPKRALWALIFPKPYLRLLSFYTYHNPHLRDGQFARVSQKDLKFGIVLVTWWRNRPSGHPRGLSTTLFSVISLKGNDG